MPDSQDDDLATRRSRHTIPQTDLYLEHAGRRYPLSGMCERWLLPREDVILPRGHAEIVSRVDGETDRWAVEVLGRSAAGNAADPTVRVRGMRLLAASEAA